MTRRSGYNALSHVHRIALHISQKCPRTVYKSALRTDYCARSYRRITEKGLWCRRNVQIHERFRALRELYLFDSPPNCGDPNKPGFL